MGGPAKSPPLLKPDAKLPLMLRLACSGGAVAVQWRFGAGAFCCACLRVRSLIMGLQHALAMLGGRFRVEGRGEASTGRRRYDVHPLSSAVSAEFGRMTWMQCGRLMV